MQKFSQFRRVLLASACALAGCTSYAPSQVASMRTYEICQLQVEQGPNLTETSRRLLLSELDRRKETCAAHRQAIQTRRDENLYEWTYRNQSP